MSSPDLLRFFLQIAVMLAVALAAGLLMRRLRLPVLLGELLAGIALGPTLLGTVAPGAYAALFPSGGPAATSRDGLIKLGMMLFLFVAGLEVDLGPLRRRSASITWTSLAGILVPFGIGFGTVLLWTDLWGAPARQDPPAFGLLIGTALAITALPVIARILMDLNLLKSEFGMVVMAAATINDLIGWSLFALILSNYGVGGAAGGNLLLTFVLVVGLAAAILVGGRRLGPRALRAIQGSLPWPGGFIALSIVLVLGVAALFEAIGIHAFLGAFLVGVALAPHDGPRDPAHETVYQFVVSFFAPIYFVSIGLQANFIANFDLLLVGVVLGIACLGKLVGASLGAWLGQMALREALAVGFGMNTRGAMEMILASVALEHGLIDRRIFVALVVMAVVTSLISGPAMSRLLRPAEAPVPAAPGFTGTLRPRS